MNSIWYRTNQIVTPIIKVYITFYFSNKYLFLSQIRVRIVYLLLNDNQSNRFNFLLLFSSLMM